MALTNEEIDAAIARSEAQKRAMAEADTGGVSRPPPVMSDPNAPQSVMAPAGPPPAASEAFGPPAPPPMPVGDRIKKGLSKAIPFVGPFLGNEPGKDPEMTKAMAEGSSSGAAPPAAEERADTPGILELQAGAPQGGGGYMTPGGWQPHEKSVTGAVPVSDQTRGAMGEALASKEAGGVLERDAEKAYFDQIRSAQMLKQQAQTDAIAEHQAVQANRAQMRQQMMARIEQLNNDANAKIDANKGWSDRGALATVMGAIGVGLGQIGAGLTHGENTAAKIVQAQMDREMQAQLANQKGAQDRANREETLLQLHLDELKDQDSAIQATKLGMYDKVLSIADQAAAERGINLADPKWLAFRGSLLENRANIINDWDKQTTGKQAYSEVYKAPRMVGGTGSKLTEERFKQMAPGDVVAIPPSSVIDGRPNAGQTKYVRVSNAATASRLQKVGGAVESLIANNREAMKLLADMDKTPIHDFQGRRQIYQRLRDLALNKVNVDSAKDEQGVVREPEYLRAARVTVGYDPDRSDWMKVSGDERSRIRNFLRFQNEQLYRQFGGEVKASGDGTVVDVQTVRDPITGVPRTVHIPTSERFNPDVVEPELGKAQE